MGNAKECSNCHTITLISHASKVMLKILQARLQQHMNRELPDVQAGFRKGRGTREQIANIRWILEKAREFQKKKHLFLLHWLCQSLWLCGSQQTVENFSRDGVPDHLTCLLINLYAGQEETELNMEQWTGSKLGKEYVKTVYYHSDYLTSMQSISWEMAGWMKHKLESRLVGET